MGKIRLYAAVKLSRAWLLAAMICVGVLFAAVFSVNAKTDADSVAVPIVMYHSVLEDTSRHGKYVISPNDFESDLEYLKENGYQTILIEDLINYTRGGTLPEKPILLTFDDGYYNNYLYAFEAAKKHNAKFVISPIGYYADAYTESGECNAYYSHATWQQLREMAESCLVEVQNHSYDLHKSDGGAMGAKAVSGESEEQYSRRLSADLLKAQQLIEDNVGRRPTAMVYPFGAISKSTPEIVRSLGFAVTLTCEEKNSTVTRSPESLYNLGRFLRPAGISSREFFEKTMGLSES